MLQLLKKITQTATWRPFLASIAFILLLVGCSVTLEETPSNAKEHVTSEHIQSVNDNTNDSDESVTDEEHLATEQTPLTSFADVSQYLREHNQLPANYITKDEARDLGWVASDGNLHIVAPGKSIGGDRFGNREGLLPKAEGRTWFEADIDYESGTRNAKRIVYSNDGLIYMTTDHYKSFTNITEKGSVINE